ncbi:MAG TPA: helix-turn-helix transcriptional regulator [Halanaerobiales bacterium]|nr:helix-turn-helix transcriptional regulator [Halanaerobiales bacterium]
MRKVLKEKRKERGMTQAEIAKEFGITRAFYGHIERETRNPTLNLAAEMADFFNDNIENLFIN